MSSGYYAWRNRSRSEHQKEDDLLTDRIEEAYLTNRRVYGSPRMHAELQAQGIRCSRHSVACLMRQRGLSARRPRHRMMTTHSEPGARVAPNVLARDASQ